jgi:hypothetical protein
MRSTITAFALISGLVLSGPSHAQGTPSPSPSVAPKQAPVGHRQPRQSDVDGLAVPPPAPPAPGTTTSPDATAGRDADDFDARLNRALNSICRGC